MNATEDNAFDVEAKLVELSRALPYLSWPMLRRLIETVRLRLAQEMLATARDDGLGSRMTLA